MTNNQTEFIRVVKNKNFTILNNGFLKRNDLSWKAKGILAYVLSLPDDWKINMNEIVRNATDGRDSFRSGWKELKDAGYIDRYPVKDKNTKKIVRWETKIFESVDLKQSKPQTEKPQLEKPQVGKPIVENPKLLSTDITKDLNIPNTDNTKEKHSPAKAEQQIPYKEIVDYLNQKAERNFRHGTDKTKRLIKARYNEGFEQKDFEKVIDIKVSQWKGQAEMEKFLRPETLFGTKFEGYLNEQFVKTNKGRDWDDWEF